MGTAPPTDLSLAAEGRDSVTVSSEFTGEVEEFLTFTRTLNSRAAWPGAQLQYEQGGHLIYSVTMRLRGASTTDIEVDETLGPVEELEDGSRCFRTAQRVTWPDGHADGLSEYRFVSGAEPAAAHTLQFTYAYAAPSTKLVKAKHLPEFKQGMQVVSARYVLNLVRAIGGG